MSEPYRTVLGHFRHEIGHFYWPILVNRPDLLDECRDLFGDDRADYAEAMKRHYEDSHRTDTSWQQATSAVRDVHPFEDWAETFAHYLHILDTLQTAESFGLTYRRRPGLRHTQRSPAGDPPLRQHDVRPGHRPLARALLRPQPGQPVHGPQGPLPVRPQPDGRS